MRRPLRQQILLPLIAVLVITVAALTLWQATRAARLARERIEKRLLGVAETVRASNFPLTQSVAEQMKSLSGAELILFDGERRLATSGIMPALESAEGAKRITALKSDTWGTNLSLAGKAYLHSALDVSGRGRFGDAAELHLFYPEADYRQALREAILPPCLAGLVAIVATSVCGWLVAGHVSRVVADLGKHVRRIAGGDFEEMPIPARDDELRELAGDVNTMAARLKEYAAHIRRTEQLRTLNQIGAGLAHEMRNAATGARMALQLHAEECPLGDYESLKVALQQLQLMETQLQRYLRKSKPHTQDAATPLNVGALLQDVRLLLQSYADHAGIELRIQLPEEVVFVSGDGDALGQVFVNLLRNALEAVSTANRQTTAAKVEASLETIGDGWLRVDIADTGPGPGEAIRDALFDPFVSQKPDGVGLGLSVAKEVVEQHQGELSWYREGETTHFVVQLPLAKQEAPIVCDPHR